MSHAPSTTSAIWACPLLAALPHLSAHPPQSANDRSNPARCEWTLPSSYTLQPSTEPSVMVNALSIPDGRLMASACAWESPTITTRAGPAGCTTLATTDASELEGTGVDASGNTAPLASAPVELVATAAAEG